MSTIQEQLAAAAKEHFETQFQLLSTFAGKAFDSVEKVIELNVDTAKTSLQNASTAANNMASAADPQAFLSASAAQAQPGAETAMDYNRRLAEIGEGVYTEFTAAAQQRVAESRKKLQDMIDEASKNAPPGSENAIAVMKSLLSNADATYEKMMASTTQALEALRSNMATASERFTQAAQDAAKGTK